MRVLRALNQAIADLDRAVTARLGEHPDAAVFTSLPRSGQINAAQMLAEWGDCREAYDEPRFGGRSRRCEPGHQAVGQVPLGGVPLGVQQALPQRDHDLRRQLPPRQPLGRRRVRRPPSSAATTTPTPVRILARAWIRVIYRCWLDRVPYDPALHGSLNRLEAAHAEELAA